MALPSSPPGGRTPYNRDNRRNNDPFAAIRRNMLPEAIMGNDVLERVAFTPPRTMADLQDVRGLGAEKASLYGLEILEFIKKHHLER